jgi:hypothetical protein
MSRTIIAARISGLPWRRSFEHLASCVVVTTRTSTDVACSPALKVPPPRDLRDATACPHKGPAVARPLDRGAAATDLGTAATTPDQGTSATARRGYGVAATGCGSTAAHALGATVVVACGVANESGWSVKNRTLSLRVLFYRRPDLVRLDQIAPSYLGFL